MISNCKNCGVEITQTPKKKLKKYCSDQCRFTYLYQNRDAYDCSPERMSECVYCGTRFNNWGNSTRKYCCQAHYIAARYGRTPALHETDDISRDHKIAFAIQQREEGLHCSKIADELGMSVNTVKIWIRRYQNNPPETQKRDPIQESAPIEVCELPGVTVRRIFLICGSAKFNGKYDNFIAQVPQLLEYNIKTGDVFVFCNKSRYQLSILQWQGDGFVLMFRRTEQERYPWPYFSDSKAVEVSRTDLEMLIEYPRFMCRLRGVPTPEFLG